MATVLLYKTEAPYTACTCGNSQTMMPREQQVGRSPAHTPACSLLCRGQAQGCSSSLALTHCLDSPGSPGWFLLFLCLFFLSWGLSRGGVLFWINFLFISIQKCGKNLGNIKNQNSIYLSYFERREVPHFPDCRREQVYTVLGEEGSPQNTTQWRSGKPRGKGESGRAHLSPRPMWATDSLWLLGYLTSWKAAASSPNPPVSTLPLFCTALSSPTQVWL